MNEKFLPIGTVVLLKGGNKKLMVTSYLIFPKKENEEKKIYDYGACTFPEGIIESDYVVGFDHEQIEKIIHLGLIDDEQKLLNEALVSTCDEVKKAFLEEAQ